MKRLLEDKQGVLSCTKKPKIYTEWLFFNRLTDYEQKRCLFALIGLSGNVDSDVIREILITFMHVSCAQHDEEGEPVPSLTRRYYCKYDGIAVFKDMRSIVYTQIKTKIEKDLRKLVEKHVPKINRYIIIANDNPRDGLGKLVLYTKDWFEEQVKSAYKEWVDLPAISLYRCVDIMNTSKVRKYLYDSSCLSFIDLHTLQNRIRRYG